MSCSGWTRQPGSGSCHSPRDGSTVVRGLDPLPSRLPEARGEVAVPRGFAAGGWTAGIKASGRSDLAVIAVTTGAPAAAAATFTPNRFAAAPIVISRRNLRRGCPEGEGRFGYASAIISTSGCANAATGAQGEVDQEAIGAAVAQALGARPEHVLALSTGVIGTRLPVDLVRDAVRQVVPGELSDASAAFEAAAEALRTTDSRRKVASAVRAGPGSTTVLGISKGVGMIHPRMATLLGVLLTDVAVPPEVLGPLLRRVVARTWDQMSVDGDTSTNDTILLLASGAAGAPAVADGSTGQRELEAAVEAVARSLARQHAADGEGAATLLTCQVSGASDDADARAVARAVVSSSLVKAALHGRDPNWGRLAMAAGNARLPDAAVLEASGLGAAAARERTGQPVEVDPAQLVIAIAGTTVYDGGPVPFDRDEVRARLDAPEALVRLHLGGGAGTGEAWGCDLTEAYVVENSAYTT